jgi:membrane-bound metal-dependent hydrolase YbcI (DUF457 family)
MSEKHRGILHSLTGILIITSVWFIIMGLLMLIIFVFTDDLLMPLLMAFPIGILFGGMIHLLEDGFTVSGVRWLQPFSKMCVRGSIKTMPKYAAKEKRLKLREREYILVWYFTISAMTTLTALILEEILLAILLVILWTIVAVLIWDIRIYR